MLSLKELIERHSERHSEFCYYIPIIEKAERNEIEHPDIAIECCASLFQGVSKSIVHRLDSSCDRKALENLSLQQQVRAALNCLKEHDDVVEDAFARGCENLTRAVASLRNTRGDISHGRAVPKELQSDRSLARLVLNLSGALLRYMLASYFALQPQPEAPITYDDNADFNDYLDELYPFDGKPLYSLALHQQYYEDYLIRLDEYRDAMEVLED